MPQTRRKLLENFDEDVRDKLRVSGEESKALLDRFERLLMQITRYELALDAEFLADHSFRLDRVPNG